MLGASFYFVVIFFPKGNILFLKEYFGTIFFYKKKIAKYL
jgi:hypothetical protein